MPQTVAIVAVGAYVLRILPEHPLEDRLEQDVVCLVYVVSIAASAIARMHPEHRNYCQRSALCGEGSVVFRHHNSKAGIPSSRGKL